MTPAPEARCARHPELAVSFTCPRCGAFGCIDCERRAGPDAAPLCPACWPLAAPSTGTLETAGLVLGVASIIPCCPIALASLIVNGIALSKATKEHRWKPLLGGGISLTMLAILALIAVMNAAIAGRAAH